MIKAKINEVENKKQQTEIKTMSSDYLKVKFNKSTA